MSKEKEWVKLCKLFKFKKTENTQLPLVGLARVKVKVLQKLQ